MSKQSEEGNNKREGPRHTRADLVTMTMYIVVSWHEWVPSLPKSVQTCDPGHAVTVCCGGTLAPCPVRPQFPSEPLGRSGGGFRHTRILGCTYWCMCARACASLHNPRTCRRNRQIFRFRQDSAPVVHVLGARAPNIHGRIAAQR